MSEVFISRQPVLDKKMQVFAYALEFNQGLHPSSSHIEATTELITSTQKEIGFKSIVGENLAITSLPKDLISLETVEYLDLSPGIMIEVSNDIVTDSKVLKSLKELKLKGYSIVLADFSDDESSIKLVSISDFVKINNEAYSDTKLKKMVTYLHEKGLKVIAGKVETEDMFNYLKAIGFDYFKGYFFTNPVIINGKKLSGNKLTLLQLMAKINNPKTDFYELTQILSQDVALSHKLLIAINHPVTMIPIRVKDIKDALLYMGLKRLKFWINMLLLGKVDDVPKELMINSLIRAKFCEQIAEKLGKKVDKDSYFLVGLFSSLSAFFKTPIKQIVAEMPLDKDILAALIYKEGVMGDALNCLAQIESTSTQYISFDIQGLGMSEIAGIYLSSTAWAQRTITT
jgi:EAL and modified HD-GYP domain-containing signal transduction protein